MAVTSIIDCTITATETGASSVGSPPRHVAQWSSGIIQIASGTGVTQNDLVYAARRTATGAADPIDLLGALTSEIRDSGTAAFVDVLLIAIRNLATTSGYKLTVGAGSNPFFSGLFKATGDAIEIPAGGFWIWYVGTVDSVSPVTATGDILNVDPGANSVSYDIMILGRSA